jgi:RHS repeat-associated protein
MFPIKSRCPQPQIQVIRGFLFLIALVWGLGNPLSPSTHHDTLGSPIAATDAAGKVIWQEGYQPYGQRLNNSQASTNNKLWFTGKSQDASGLVYMGARYYHPALGRFLSRDPVNPNPKNPLSFNRYAYANDNPYRFVDPDGRSPVDILGLSPHSGLSPHVKPLQIDVLAESGIPSGGIAKMTPPQPVGGNGGEKRLGGKTQNEATGFLGRAGNELKNASYQKVRNEPAQINSRDFSGHALDQMQNRGVMPSVVENTVNTGQQFPTRTGTTGYYDSINNTRVIVNSDTGRVVTVIRGAP